MDQHSCRISISHPKKNLRKMMMSDPKITPHKLHAPGVQEAKRPTSKGSNILAPIIGFCMGVRLERFVCLFYKKLWRGLRRGRAPRASLEHLSARVNERLSFYALLVASDLWCWFTDWRVLLVSLSVCFFPLRFFCVGTDRRFISSLLA